MKFLGFFAQKFQVRSTFILDVFGLVGLILPVSIGLPLIILFLLVVVAEIEVLFFGSLFAICDLLVFIFINDDLHRTHSSSQLARSGRDGRYPVVTSANLVAH
jgi:hypothetical protein